MPYSMTFSKAHLRQAMNQYSELFIKPVSGSVGSGVIKIKRSGGGRWNVYWKRGKPAQTSAAQTVAFLMRQVGGRSYLIQEAVPLAKYKGRPYDLRVAVQRGQTGQWQMTGMVGKVAAKGSHVTNVAKGGRAKGCERLFRHSGLPVAATKRDVRQASLKIAAFLGRKLPHLADLGLDMGVDRNGRVKFIEMNCRDQRYSFKLAGMRSAFYETYRTPLAYAKFLTKANLSSRKK
ncbi:YheC/YheD family protein [Paenibacillus piri]|uniref:YheC/YheD family protein n=1 Tax=Paenibacillus piri TaxID=2547395 RepID=A0A4R5KQQ5_9BACL|nr:YheC/YheD family protein [Paenibacillus piri]